MSKLGKLAERAILGESTEVRRIDLSFDQIVGLTYIECLNRPMSLAEISAELASQGLYIDFRTILGDNQGTVMHEEDGVTVTSELIFTIVDGDKGHLTRREMCRRRSGDPAGIIIKVERDGPPDMVDRIMDRVFALVVSLIKKL